MSKDKRIFDLAVRIIRIKELHEKRIWLLMIVKANLIKLTSKPGPLIHENNELISIL